MTTAAMKEAWPAAAAARRAEKVLEAIQPFCTAAEVAGSLRRERPLVRDVDIVCIPKPGQLIALQKRATLAAELIQDGTQNFKVRCPDGLQVDFWLAQPEGKDLLDTRPSTWGTVLLCYTGSREFNVWLHSKARAKGMHWNPVQGLFQGSTLVASASELAIFTALGLDFIKPKDRER